MQYTSTILAAAGLLTTVSAHGFISSPQPRMPGNAMKTACGQQVYYNQMSDHFGNIQGELQVAASQSDYNAAACNIWLCKGYKYDDNTANVQSWTAGQVVPFTFDVHAPHTGTANVSIVNTATNTIIGSPLVTYSDFADNGKSRAANELAFSITVPSDLGSTCSTAGACVVQHWWNAESINQTYESCVDFTVGGTGTAASANYATTSAAASTSPSTTAAVQAVSAIKAAPTTLQTMTKTSSAASQATPSTADNSCAA